MAEGENQGWFGTFSVAGKLSAQRYRIISQHNSVLNGKTKKIKVKDIFSPDEESDKFESSIDEKIDLFNSGISTNTNTKFPSPQNMSNKTKTSLKNSKSSSKLKYHNKHMNEIKLNKQKEEEPPCTKYNPKMDYIWNKTLTGPKWKTIRGRVHHISYDEKDFYINHEDISQTNKKGFIEMSKQTMRNGFPVRNDLRIRYEKKYTPQEKKTFWKKPRLNLVKSKSLKDIRIKASTLRETRHKGLNSSSLQPRGCLSPSYSYSALQNKCLLVPDFKKTISREKSNEVISQKKLDIPFSNPDKSGVMDRPVMMVMYDKSSNRKKKINFIRGVMSSNVNIEKVYDKINNYRHPVVPIFSKMTSRPEDKGPLPSFMRQIYTRASAYSTTDKTLEMNNFSEGKYLDFYTSFFPKRSFNKNINLALLNSDKIETGLIENKPEFNKLGTFLARTMRFYRKDIDELMKENEDPKFDYVTYKSMERRKNKSSSESKRILINLNNIN